MLESTISRARADALFATIVPSAVTGLIGAVIIGTMMWRTPAQPGATLFIAATVAILVVRLILFAAYRRHAVTPMRWMWGATALVAVSGITWGAMMFWSTHAASNPQLLVATAITLGAVMITIPSASFWPAHLAFHLPASLLAALGFLTSGRPGHLQIGIATLFLCVAMAIAGRRLGKEILRAMRLSAENAALAEQLRQQTMELSTANDELETLSRTDPLTGLANRRCFMDALEAQWARSRRSSRPVALLAIDVDHFKRYNDTYGHGAGDACLQRVAALLSGSARGETDLAARPGGEEFAVLLPGVDAEAAGRVAERIRALVEKATRAVEAGLPEAVTVSIGVAAMPAGGEAAERLLVAADRALYRAKETGRNRVEVDRVGPSATAIRPAASGRD